MLSEFCECSVDTNVFKQDILIRYLLAFVPVQFEMFSILHKYLRRFVSPSLFFVAHPTGLSQISLFVITFHIIAFVGKRSFVRTSATFSDSTIHLILFSLPHILYISILRQVRQYVSASPL